MGKVNEYINKLLKYVKKDAKINKEKPWLKYFDNTPESLK